MLIVVYTAINNFRYRWEPVGGLIDWQTSLKLIPLTALLGSNGNGLLCRQMIRMTWGNDKYLKQINATLLFVVGRFPNLKIQWRLEQEGKK